MYAPQDAYLKQRHDNLLPTRSPPNSDNDRRQRRRREGQEAMNNGLFRSSAYSSSSGGVEAAGGGGYRHPFAAAVTHHEQDHRQQHASKRRRVRQLLLLASLAFVGLLVIDGMAQFNYLPDVNVQTVYQTAEQYEQKLMRRQQQQKQQENGEGGFVRRLVGAFLGDEELIVNNKHRPHIVAASDDNNNQAAAGQPEKQRALLHTIPLLPKHALQHRQRRDLIASSKPIPQHLREGHEDELFHAPPHQRRRMYPVLMEEDMKVVDRRNRHLADGLEGGNDDAVYETGALYQGYGTHYLDLWVGSPPQRQTVIVDTGSSITAFPCSGCDHCGDNPATGEIYHLDEDFDKFKSSTYQQFECVVGQKNKHNIKCSLGVCQRGSNSEVVTSDDHQVCQMAVSYAEGSSWTAIEGSDVVYPAGPHETALLDYETRKAEGVGSGMGEIDAGKEFDWMDFRLQFGCQTKVSKVPTRDVVASLIYDTLEITQSYRHSYIHVCFVDQQVTGLFRSQLEDGIMGMDNRPGAFWMQLRDHYKSHGRQKASTGEREFDPNQFALCYDRRPLTSELAAGVGSGALTLGGSDPLLHLTPMVYADNVTPSSGWYTVHVKGMFLRAKGGSLSDSPKNARYVRVDADETTLNGNVGPNHGIIVDSGTTDTYLPSNLKRKSTSSY